MVRSTLIQGTFKPILSNFYFELLFSLPLNWRWDFFWSGKKLHLIIVSIWLLEKNKFFSHIVENIIGILLETFERFLMNNSEVRLNLLNFCPKKNLTSNRSKPIRVLARIWSSCSDDRLPNAYSLHDFLPCRPPSCLVDKRGSEKVALHRLKIEQRVGIG